ncbi:cytochrome b [Parashewanella tropica]|uniref:cytochrome b n=1 Tax=Parashewanella tropica TaxID=2547970 RepID=UPI00105AA24F|nr:cytochrome b [Parashewanella tropica]
MSQRLSKVSIIMHWVVGIGMLGMLVLGWSMHKFKLHSLYPWHKSIGVLIVCLAVIRVLWRLKEGWFPPATPMGNYEKLLSRSVHLMLLIITVLFPISGMLMSGAGGHGIAFFGHVLLAENIDPITHKVIPLSHILAALGEDTHKFLMWALAIIFLVHISAVIKHHFYSKDETLNRMLGK